MVAVRSGLPSVAIEVRDHHSVREPSRVFAGQEVSRFLVSGVLIVFAGMILPEAALSQSYPFDHLVVFGDSVSDTGNGTLIWGEGPHSAIPQNNYSNNRYTDGLDTSPA